MSLATGMFLVSASSAPGAIPDCEFAVTAVIAFSEGYAKLIWKGPLCAATCGVDVYDVPDFGFPLVKMSYVIMDRLLDVHIVIIGKHRLSDWVFFSICKAMVCCLDNAPMASFSILSILD